MPLTASPSAAASTRLFCCTRWLVSRGSLRTPRCAPFISIIGSIRTSTAWRAHCDATAAQLGVAFTAVAVQVDASSGEGLEAAARRARYDALRGLLRPEEVLVTAHHADDQLETVLLALMRGAGLAGMSGTAARQSFGPGCLVRPLLAFARADLETWARREGLGWIEDPSNANTDLDRNFIRARVAPALAERWPAAARSAARSSRHLGEAAEALEALAQADLEGLIVGEQLDVAGLLALDPARRRNALRHWIRRRGARSPSTRKLAAIEQDLLTAGPDRTPLVDWDDVRLRRYRGRLYLDRRPAEHQAGGGSILWDARAPLELPAGLGRLELRQDPAGGISALLLAQTLVVRFRGGGETIRPLGDVHQRSLKKMLQAAGVPPWRRSRLPLIYSDDRLVAVGDLWIAGEFAASGGDAVRIVWERSETDSA